MSWGGSTARSGNGRWSRYWSRTQYSLPLSFPSRITSVTFDQATMIIVSDWQRGEGNCAAIFVLTPLRNMYLCVSKFAMAGYVYFTGQIARAWQMCTHAFCLWFLLDFQKKQHGLVFAATDVIEDVGDGETSDGNIKGLMMPSFIPLLAQTNLASLSWASSRYVFKFLCFTYLERATLSLRCLS